MIFVKETSRPLPLPAVKSRVLLAKRIHGHTGKLVAFHRQSLLPSRLRSSFASPRWWWFLHGASGVGSPPPRLPHHAPGGWFKLALINIAVVCLLPVCSCWSRPKHGMHHRDPHAEPLDLHARHDGGQDRDEQGEPALRSACNSSTFSTIFELLTKSGICLCAACRD